MKKYFLALILLPLLSCGNNNNKTKSSAAYQTDEVARVSDHNKWNALLQKNVRNVNYKAFQKIAIAGLP
jgi:hypothetical protein